MSDRVDFSGEEWDRPWSFADGCWVIANKHGAGLNDAFQVNNRTFVFRLTDASGAAKLFVFGCAGPPVLDVVKGLSEEAGCPVGWVVSNGGAHHLFLDLWYQAFPEARVLIPAKRIPDTRNGQNLKAKYPDRWELLHGPRPEALLEELGDQIDIAIFDQLYSYRDQHAAEVADAALDHTSKRVKVGGFGLMGMLGKMMKDTSQPNDEVFLLHRASGTVIAGHNFPFLYKPKGHKPRKEHELSMGGFPMSWMFALMMPKGSFKSGLEGQAAPIADPAIHAATWEHVLSWDFDTWITAHDPPTTSGPPLGGEALKEAVRASIHRSGEDDPTGARLKWTKKHGAPSPAFAAKQAAES